MYPYYKKLPPVFDREKYLKYNKMGGFLLVSLLSKMLAIVLNSALLSEALLTIKIMNTASAAVMRTKDYQETYAGILYLAVFASILLVAQAIVVMLFFMKTPRSIYAIRALIIIAFVALMVTQYLYNITVGTDASIVRYIDIVWLIYFFKSERVKYYFRLIKKPRTFRPVQDFDAPSKKALSDITIK